MLLGLYIMPVTQFCNTSCTNLPAIFTQKWYLIVKKERNWYAGIFQITQPSTLLTREDCSELGF